MLFIMCLRALNGRTLFCLFAFFGPFPKTKHESFIFEQSSLSRHSMAFCWAKWTSLGFYVDAFSVFIVLSSFHFDSELCRKIFSVLWNFKRSISLITCQHSPFFRRMIWEQRTKERHDEKITLRCEPFTQSHKLHTAQCDPKRTPDYLALSNTKTFKFNVEHAN